MSNYPAMSDVAFNQAFNEAPEMPELDDRWNKAAIVFHRIINTAEDSLPTLLAENGESEQQINEEMLKIEEVLSDALYNVFQGIKKDAGEYADNYEAPETVRYKKWKTELLIAKQNQIASQSILD